MSGPDHDEEFGLLNLAELSLDDMSRLDDSVVANAIRLLHEMRRSGGEFSEFNQAP